MKNHEVVLWIEKNLRCSNRTSRFNAKKVKLMPWQIELINQIWIKKNNKYTRQVEEILIDTCRKTGKTEFVAYLICYLLFARECQEPRPIHYKHASPTFIQSKIIFEMLKSIIINSPTLVSNEQIDIKLEGEVHNHENECSFEILSGKVKTKQGLNFSHGSVDESDFLENDALELLEGSMALSEKPFMIYLTNAPEEKKGFIVDKIEYGRKVAKGEVKDKTFLPFIKEITEKEAENYKSPRVWEKANPSFGYLVKPQFYNKMIKGIKNQPSKLINFKRLFLGLHSYQSSASWVSPDVIQSVSPNEIPRGLSWYGGLDMSTSNDITSFVLVAEENNKLYIRNYNFIPRAKLEKREDRNSKAVKGFLKTQDKNLFISQEETIDIAFVEKKILEIKERDELKFKHIGVDRVKHTYFSRTFDKKFNLLAFSQQPTQFTAPIIYLEDMLLKRRVVLEENKLFLWSLGNVRMGNPLASPARMFYKKKSLEAIDPIVATAMACGVLMKLYSNNRIPKLLL